MKDEGIKLGPREAILGTKVPRELGLLVKQAARAENRTTSGFLRQLLMDKFANEAKATR